MSASWGFSIEKKKNRAVCEVVREYEFVDFIVYSHPCHSKSTWLIKTEMFKGVVAYESLITYSHAHRLLWKIYRFLSMNADGNFRIIKCTTPHNKGQQLDILIRIFLLLCKNERDLKTDEGQIVDGITTEKCYFCPSSF